MSPVRRVCEFARGLGVRRLDACHVRDDNTDAITVFDPLLATGLSLELVEDHLRSGRVELNGEVVTDPYRLAPPPARLVLVAG